jgi:APA family basic amino acid/polyamine antiporter
MTQFRKMAQGQPSSQKPLFARNATGLVRSFTWYDALIVSLAVTGPTLFGISSQIGYVAPNGPGADFVTSALIGLLFMVPLGVMYYIYSAHMPRSGGDYVWLGRSLNPGLGFVGGWAMFISFIALLASASVTEPAVVFPDVAVAWGYIWHNPGLISWGTSFPSSSTNLFLVTMLTIIIAIIIISLGPRVYSRIMIALAVIIFLATAIFIGAYASASNASFAAGISSMTGGSVTYQSIISAAQKAGISYVPVNTTATLLAIPFGVLLFNGFNYSVYVSGEVRNARRSMLWGVLGALAICGLIDITGLYFVVRAESYQFVQAAFGLAGSSSGFPLGASPWSPLFIPAVLGNAYLASFVEFGFLLFNFWWAAGLALATSRYVFAFSFDRVLPTFFADVNQRLRFPLKATALVLVLSAILAYFAIYTTYIGQLLNTVTIWSIVWVLVGISAIVFPFVRKDLAQGLPGGRWLLPVFGGLSIIAMGATFYWSVTNKAIGPSSPSSTALLVVIFAVGAIIFAARYFYFRGRGIDMGKALKEIPPE